MILLTGGSGLLGKELKKYIDCIAPDSNKLDITKYISPKTDVDTIIHAAAYTDVVRAETHQDECFRVNVTGTYNLLKAYPSAKIVYISSEYVTNPVNFYAKTKLWAEELVLQRNIHLIIRTSFVPRPFPHKFAFADQYTEGDYVDVIAPLIAKQIIKGSVGTINVGTGRKTMFELARQTVPHILGNSVDDVEVKLPKNV